MRVVRGFTLIELMIVVAIIGLVSALAVPNFNEMRKRHIVRGDVEKVVAGLQDLRNFARTRLRCVEVSITPKEIVGKPYAANSTSGGNPCKGVDTDPDALLGDHIMRIELENVTLGAFSAPGLSGNLWFDRQASTFNQATGRLLYHPAELTVTGAPGETFKIRVYPATGAIRWVK